MDELAQTGAALTHQLLDNPAYMQASEQCVPAQYRMPNENPQPNFMTVDFGLVRNADGTLTPKLVELQAFPSIFGYQDILTRQYIETYNLDPTLTRHLGGLNEQTYWQLLSKVILNNHAPENVILLEVDPDHQKTLPDFHIYEDKLGIATVDITTLIKRGNRLFYHRNGREIPIHRIYNRAIVDELERKNIQLPFDYRDELDVEWAGPIPTGTSASANSPSHTSTTPLSPKPPFSTTGMPTQISPAFPKTATSFSSSPFTPLQGREFSSPPPAPTLT